MWMRIFLILIVWMLWMGTPAAQEMQTTRVVNEIAYEMTLDSDTVEAWLGRERQKSHPVVPGLEARDEATLHFYFTRTYGQRAESVMRSAQSAREKSLRFLPEETVAGINIYLLGNINEYFEAQNSRGRAPEWAAGLTLLSDGVILIRLAPNGMTRIEPERTLAHELNHAALRRYAHDNFFPHWFYEGLAMLATEDWNLNRSEAIGRASMSGQLLKLDEIDPAFGKTGPIVDLAYAQSAHFVSWLDKSYGDEAIQKLIRDTASGTPFEDAFSAAFGRSLKDAYSTWYKSMSRGKNVIVSLLSKDGLFAVFSIFAAVGLVVALKRKTAIRKRRKESMGNATPLSALPENLRHFGPFT